VISVSKPVTLTSTEAAYALAAVQLKLEAGVADEPDRVAYQMLKHKLAENMELAEDTRLRLGLTISGRA